MQEGIILPIKRLRQQLQSLLPATVPAGRAGQHHRPWRCGLRGEEAQCMGENSKAEQNENVFFWCPFGGKHPQVHPRPPRAQMGKILCRQVKTNHRLTRQEAGRESKGDHTLLPAWVFLPVEERGCQTRSGSYRCMDLTLVVIHLVLSLAQLLPAPPGQKQPLPACPAPQQAVSAWLPGSRRLGASPSCPYTGLDHLQLLTHHGKSLVGGCFILPRGFLWSSPTGLASYQKRCWYQSLKCSLIAFPLISTPFFPSFLQSKWILLTRASPSIICPTTVFS